MFFVVYIVEEYNGWNDTTIFVCYKWFGVLSLNNHDTNINTLRQIGSVRRLPSWHVQCGAYTRTNSGSKFLRVFPFPVSRRQPRARSVFVRSWTIDCSLNRLIDSDLFTKYIYLYNCQIYKYPVEVTIVKQWNKGGEKVNGAFLNCTLNNCAPHWQGWISTQPL